MTLGICICDLVNLYFEFCIFTSLHWWENSRQVNQIQRQPGEMIVRSVEIDKDLRIVLIFFCRDPLDCRGGQTRALVTGCCAWWSQIYLKTDRIVWNCKRIVKVNSFWHGYRNTMIKDYTNTINKEIRNIIITQMQWSKSIYFEMEYFGPC